MPPTAWTKSKVRYLAKYINGAAFKPEDWSATGIPIVRIQNLTDPEATFNHYEGDLPEKYRLHQEDILLPWSASPGIHIWNGNVAWLNQHIFKVEPDENIIDRRYYYWLATWFIPEMERMLHGSTMQHFTWNAFASFDVLLPPKPEQSLIADFLERETSKADTLVARYERLIELLEERHTALITLATTKGLDPNVPMKDSGVDWIGNMPAHWTTARNKTLFYERDDRSTLGNEELLSVSHLTGVTPRSEKNVNMFMSESLEGYKICQKGDLAINTMWAWMEALGISPCDGIVSPSYNVYVIRNHQVLDPAFYELLCRIPAHVSKIKSVSTGVRESRLRCYPADFFDMNTCLPPLSEQREIVAKVAQQVRRSGELSTKATQAISLVREHRAALITAAVTGQIDVTTYKTSQAVSEKVST